jgi:hypothetical protein
MIVAPLPARPNGYNAVVRTFGTLPYHEAEQGRIVVAPSWEAENLVWIRTPYPGLRPIRIHKILAAIFEACLRKAHAHCPDYKLRLLSGYFPRRKMFRSTAELSLHAWGCAFDVNWDTNGVGTNAPCDLPPDFVAAFTEAGWEWGGTWVRSKDYMHFQYCTGC